MLNTSPADVLKTEQNQSVLNSLEYQIDRSNKKLLSRYCPQSLIHQLEKTGILEQIRTQSLEDLLCFAAKDPAASNSPSYVFQAYRSFHAVRLYRVAHAIDTLSKTDQVTAFSILARRISELAKAQTGIEIHPAAKIGCRFVVDHGFGTVVGETAEVGDDCYFLQGIVLGAKGIAGNQAVKRHPTLGNRVELGGFVRIFGAVTIGNNVKISPCVVITSDIPANSTVVLKTINQITRYS